MLNIQSERGEHCYFTTVNNQKFAFFDKEITADKTNTIDLKEHHVVLLQPMKAVQSHVVRGVHVIALSTIFSEKGGMEFSASKDFVSIGASFTATNGKISVNALNDVHALKYNTQMIQIIKKYFLTLLKATKLMILFKA